MKTAILCDDTYQAGRVYGAGRREAVAACSDLLPGVVRREDIPARRDELRDVEAAFSTWGMWSMSAEEMSALPRLRAVFYAAGSVRGLAEPLLARGVSVVSAWAANAVPVAEFALAQVLLSCKGYFANSAQCRDQDRRRSWSCTSGPGAYGETVAILGAGQIGRRVIGLLKGFTLRVVVYDPYLSAEEAARLGVERVSLEEAFARALVVSNHIPDLPATRGLLRGAHFAAMRQGATFINTGRGAQVVEPEMTAVLASRPDLTALLDVTLPEPPEAGSPLYTLPNVHMSSHIAGSLGDEVLRMADWMIEEFQAWRAGKPLRYAVDAAMLERMA